MLDCMQHFCFENFYTQSNYLLIYLKGQRGMGEFYCILIIKKLFSFDSIRYNDNSSCFMKKILPIIRKSIMLYVYS